MHINWLRSYELHGKADILSGKECYKQDPTPFTIKTDSDMPPLVTTHDDTEKLNPKPSDS